MASDGTVPKIDLLLRLVPDNPEAVLSHLSSNPDIASTADTSGYSLLHAAASYSQVELLRTLVKTYNVPVDIKDEEGETPLFAAETLAAAQCLVEELGADISIRNEDGVSAEENANANMDDGGDWMLVADYLERRRTALEGGASTQNDAAAASSGDVGDVPITQSVAGSDSGLQHPPPLPAGVRITGMKAVPEAEVEETEAPDPEFRRRIDELAARDDFEGEEGQRELKNLVSEVVSGLSLNDNQDRDVRRRVE